LFDVSHHNSSLEKAVKLTTSKSQVKLSGSESAAKAEVAGKGKKQLTTIYSTGESRSRQSKH
jgi:hypothetical protein